jgi:hypothetical protein
MSADRKVICRSEDGVEAQFSYAEDAEFYIESLEGFMSVINGVTTSENTMIDGSTYQGSVTKEKPLTIVCHMDKDYINRRNFLYKCFKPKMFGTLIYCEGDERRQISYITESVVVDESGVVRNGSINLRCPVPFFEDEQDTAVTMAGWVAGFEWPHEFKAGGEEFGYRKTELTKAIENDSAADNIGIEVLIEANGAVTNPVLYHTEQGEHIQIGTTAYPFTMAAGESLRITTGTNEKDVVYIKNGVETSVNEYLSDDSEFIQLIHGKNTFTFDADAGRDYMNVTITYRLRYLGV